MKILDRQTMTVFLALLVVAALGLRRQPLVFYLFYFLRHNGGEKKGKKR